MENLSKTQTNLLEKDLQKGVMGDAPPKITWEEKKKTYFRDYYRKKHSGKTMVCSCGKHIATGSYKKHLKSNYHLKHSPQ